MKIKERIAPYLTLSRKERIGVILLGMLILALFGLPSLLPSADPPAPGPADTAWIMAMKRLEEKGSAEKAGNGYGRKERQTGSGHLSYPTTSNPASSTLFPFDPNLLDAAGWARLGLREKTIKTILNYVSKGGRFRKPEDLERIYGLFPDEYERLRPYIRIAATEYPVAAAKGPEKWPEHQAANKPAGYKRPSVEINTADTSAWIALPGIGSKLAQRIVLFREKLGGFYSIKQVAETFGLADSVFQKIEPLLKLENSAVRKININTASAEELKVHPYMKWGVINAIIAYRKEHGPFRKKEELKQVMAVTEEVYAKLAPYLITE
jgi:competence protein ComEA